MSNSRIILTEDEKIAMNVLGDQSNGTMFNLADGRDINEIIHDEKARKFNDELNKFASKMEGNRERIAKYSEELGDKVESIEILPMFSRILVKPFVHNPFQKITIKNGIIVDVGGYRPEADKDPLTGEYKEQDQKIITGAVIEVGPETKYIKPGDVVYYRVETAVPVPFLKQGMFSLSENQIIAIVNEGLSKRFEEINNGRE